MTLFLEEVMSPKTECLNNKPDLSCTIEIANYSENDDSRMTTMELVAITTNGSSNGSTCKEFMTYKPKEPDPIAGVEDRGDIREDRLGEALGCSG